MIKNHLQSTHQCPYYSLRSSEVRHTAGASLTLNANLRLAPSGGKEKT